MADESYEEGQERPRRQFQQFPQRSTASANWRAKDDSPRADPQPRRPGQTENRNSGQFNSPRQQSEVSGTRLYVGNLLYSAQKDDIANFFAENGFSVTNVSMSIDPMTGRNPSYCFVDFESVDEASRAMSELNGKDVLGRTVRINPGVAKRAGEGSAAPQGRTFNNRGWGRDGQQQQQQQQQQDGYSQPSPYNTTNRYNSRTGDTQTPFHNTVTSSDTPTKRLYIGNLPAMDSSTAEATLTDLFTTLNIEVSSISKLIAPHESKKDQPGDHHYCFVELVRPEDVDAAIEALDGKNPGWGSDGTLRVNKAREQGQRGGQQRGGYGGGFQGRRTEGFRDWRKAAAEDQTGGEEGQ